jgi:actin-related protein 5
LERRNARRQRRQDMAKRRTAAAQERMRLISQLARKEKRDDNFGMRDEDWDVYKVINKVLITVQSLIWDWRDCRHVTC